MTPCTALLLLALPQQIRIAEHHGEQQYEWTGFAVAGLDDLDGDGYPEFLSCAPHRVEQPGSRGVVEVLSGLDGHVLYSLGGHPGQTIPFGWSAARIGDLDGDGLADFAIGHPNDSSVEPNRGSVRLFSAADGSELRVLHGSHAGQYYGYEVGPAGDVDGDGSPDVIVGSLIDGTTGVQAGSAQVVSGADGTVLHTWYGTQNFAKFGSAVTGVGDASGDGVPDLLVGAQEDGGGLYHGRAYLLSGADGSELLSWEGGEVDYLGSSVAGPGDVDGDGLADVAVGARLSGYVHVYSGVTGDLLYELRPEQPATDFGIALSAGGDLDGDGRRDLLVGSTEEARVYGFSGANGAPLFVQAADVPGFLEGEYGGAVDFGGTIAGAGTALFVVGARVSDAGGNDQGSTLLYAREAFWTTFCETSPNSVGSGASIHVNGDLSLATNATRLEASGCPPNQFAVFYFGPNRLQVPFGEGWRCVGGSVIRLNVFSTGASGTPSYLLDFTSGNGQLLEAGTRWHFQCWYRDPAGGGTGFNLSDGAEVWFRP